MDLDFATFFKYLGLYTAAILGVGVAAFLTVAVFFFIRGFAGTALRKQGYVGPERRKRDR